MIITEVEENPEVGVKVEEEGEGEGTNKKRTISPAAIEGLKKWQAEQARLIDSLKKEVADKHYTFSPAVTKFIEELGTKKVSSGTVNNAALAEFTSVFGANPTPGTAKSMEELFLAKKAKIVMAPQLFAANLAKAGVILEYTKEADVLKRKLIFRGKN